MLRWGGGAQGGGGGHFDDKIKKNHLFKGCRDKMAITRLLIVSRPSGVVICLTAAKCSGCLPNITQIYLSTSESGSDTSVICNSN